MMVTENNTRDEEQESKSLLPLHRLTDAGESAPFRKVDGELYKKNVESGLPASPACLEDENYFTNCGAANLCDFQAPEEGNSVTYLNLLKSYRPFRLYLASYLMTQAGEWFTYVASIELIEHLLGAERATSRKYISLLIVFRLIPFFILIPFGGILADSKDRRHTMMFLDAIGAIAPLLYLFASYFESIAIVYMVTLLQASIGALYEPCRTSIVPLMVPEENYMQKATTLAGLTWSAMAAIGSGLGGYMVGQIGMNACFVIDSASFIVSGLLLSIIGGTWCVSNECEEKMTKLQRIEDMTVNCFRYIKSEPFWPIMFLKVSTCLIYGGADTLYVSFSEEDPLSSEQEQSQKLGALFFSVGAGCLLGPILLEPFTSMSDPISLLDACIFSLILQAAGWFSMGYLSPFKDTLLSSVARAAGSSLSWIDSQIMLQMLVKPEMLGRIVAIDYGMALATEALSAVIAGLLQDNFDLTARQSCMFFGVLAAALVLIWLCYRIFGSSSLLPTSTNLFNASQLNNEHSTERSKLVT